MRRKAARALSVALVIGLSGCSIVEDFQTSDFAKQGGDEIVTAASQAMRGITAMRVTGNVRDNGHTYFLDVHLDEDVCHGSVRFGDGNMDVRRIGRRAWVRGDASALRAVAGTDAPPGVLDQQRTKWRPVDSVRARQLCDRDSILASFVTVDLAGKDQSKKAGPIAVGEESTLGDEKVVAVTSSPGGSHSETLWVASESPHHVLRMRSSNVRAGGDLAFSELDRKVEVTAPRGRALLGR